MQLLSFRVVIINASSIGSKQFMKPTRLFIVSFINTTVSEKFAIISVIIRMYCT